MCTRARLVQGARSTAWFGMPHDAAPAADVLVQPSEPAYLEVTVDPAAHGDAGLGRIQRGVVLTTAGGQALRFELTAQVTR